MSFVRLEVSDADGGDGWMSTDKIESDLARPISCLDSFHIRDTQRRAFSTDAILHFSSLKRDLL